MEGMYHIKNNICVIQLEGIIALGEINRYKALTKYLFDQGGFNGMIFNFDAASMIDSSAIGWMMSVYKSLQRQGGKMALCSLNNNIMSVMNATRLDEILCIYQTENDALSLLQSQ